MRIYQFIAVLALAGGATAHIRQVSQCTTAADCTCADNQVADCHHGHCACHHDGGHHPRNICDHVSGCYCPDGQAGWCDHHGNCDCRDNTLGKRQLDQCTTAADCSCASNQVADCHHGHCACHHDSGHHPIRSLREILGVDPDRIFNIHDFYHLCRPDTPDCGDTV